MYEVQFNPTAARALRKLPASINSRLITQIETLQMNPRPQGVTKLTGYDSIYRIRVSDYRVLYEIKEQLLLVVMIDVGHRTDIYRGF